VAELYLHCRTQRLLDMMLWWSIWMYRLQVYTNVCARSNWPWPM